MVHVVRARLDHPSSNGGIEMRSDVLCARTALTRTVLSALLRVAPRNIGQYVLSHPQLSLYRQLQGLL